MSLICPIVLGVVTVLLLVASSAIAITIIHSPLLLVDVEGVGDDVEDDLL